MKKLFFLYLALILLLVSCDLGMPGTVKTDPADSISICRYDRVESRFLTTGDYSYLQDMNRDFPRETRTLVEDLLKLGPVDDRETSNRLLEFYRDSVLQNVILEVETRYAEMDDVEEQMKKAFVLLRKELPDIAIPTFYTQIGAFDQSIVVDHTSVGISLDKYLGVDYHIYQRFYDETQISSMRREYIVPDCMVFYLLSLYPLPNYEDSTQMERDYHISKFFWVANNVCGRTFFKSEYVSNIERYMKANPKMNIKQLLEMSDYLIFEN